MDLEKSIDTIRASFPALSRKYKNRNVVYFDGPGGTQMHKDALKGMVHYWENGSANVHGQFPTSKELEVVVDNARQALADMLGCKANEIAFGANATSMIFAVSRAISRNWKEGDEIVLSEIDHHANVDPWILAAKDKGVVIRWIPVNTKTYSLDLSNLDSIITEKTVLVTTSYASNAVGTINDIETIAKRAHEVNAIMSVDAVHIAPHKSIDMQTLGADVLFCSAYKFFAGHIGIAALKTETFDSIDPYKLRPAPSSLPGKFETGTQSHEAMSSIIWAIEFVKTLGQGNTARERIVSGFNAIEAYENTLANYMRKSLELISGLSLHQADENTPKTATIAFTLENKTPEEICYILANEYGIFAANGDFYATTLAEKCDLQKTGNWARIGLAPYNTLEECDYFLHAIKQIAKSSS